MYAIDLKTTTKIECKEYIVNKVNDFSKVD